MGNIPTFATPVGAVPAVQGVPLADTQVFAAPYRAQQQAGEATAQLGMSFAEKYIGAKLEVDAADQTANLSKQLQQVQFDASKIPDRAQATAHYDAETQKIFDTYEQSGANPLVKAHVFSRTKSEQTLRRADTQHQAWQLESSTSRAKLIEQGDEATKQAVSATDPRLREVIIQNQVKAIDGRVASGMMNPEAGAKAKIDFESGVYRSLIDVEMAKNPRVGMAMYDMYKGKLNAVDGHIVGIQSEDKRVELKAEELVNKRLPVLGTYGNVSHWGKQIEGAAASSGVRASLIAGIASEESAGDAGAISPAGAGGPMQFMPDTAQAEGVSNRHDPNEAIPKGAGYFKKQMDRFGDETTALAAYNWGPENAAKWKAAGSDFSKLPKETQNYIRSVQAKDKQFGASATGDALANYRTEALKAEQELLADNAMDPRERQRALTILQQRSRTTEGLVLSQRKQLQDTAETASLGLFNGSYIQGTFAKIAQGYRDTGDNSQAGVYDWLASNEGALRDFGSLPPGAQRTLAHILPGAAGKIAQSILADNRTDRKEMRELAVQQHGLLTKGVQEGLDPVALAQNAKDAAGYYVAAGDKTKAKEVLDTYSGLVEGWSKGHQPTAQAEADLRNLREIAESSGGLDAKTSAALQALQKGVQRNRETWANDTLVAAERYIGPLEPFKPGMSGADLQLWANKRVQQAGTAQYMKDPTSTVPTVPMMTQTEIDGFKASWLKGSVQDRQVMAAQFSTAIPAEQIPLIAQKIAGDKQGDAMATAMAFYKRGQPGDRQIADSLIVGANAWAEGGLEGREKIKLDPTTFSQINGLLGTARAGMDGRDMDMQNNAVAARYVALMGAKDSGGVVDTTVLRQAVGDVIGTAMTYHGSQHILPTGVQPYQFEDGIAGMTVADLPALRPAGDTPITVERIKRSATYQSVGDGLYKVWMPDPKAGGTHEVLKTDGRPWVLDIRPLISRGKASLSDVEGAAGFRP